MAQMVVEGVSTRKVAAVVERLCGQAPSKSQMSEACAGLDAAVAGFRSRPIGFESCDGESEETWSGFLRSLRSGGMGEPLLVVVSDAHEGLGRALRKELQGVAWQRCQFHFSRNVSGKAPRKYQSGLRSKLADMFNSATVEEARGKCREIADEYRGVADDAVRCLEDGFDGAMTVMALPRGIRRYLRTNNHIERLNRELKRRPRVIGAFPNEESLVRLMGSVLIERDEAHARLKAAYSRESYLAMVGDGVPGRLRNIAEDQKAMLLAA